MPDVLPVVRTPELGLTIQLEKLLKQHFHGKLWGVNEQIRKRTGLSLAQIRGLRKNTAKSISIDTLQRICGYLISECHMPPAELLGTLFGIEPCEFWRMFGSPTSSFFQVQLCQGVRNDPAISEPRWVNAYDAYLSATFIRQLVASDAQRQPDVEECLCRSYVEQHSPEIFAEAKSMHDRFRQGSGSRALVCIGSVKSLPLSECVLADVFRIEPFVSRGKVRRPHGLPVPVFFRYRENDPAPLSAFGGPEFVSSKEDRAPASPTKWTTSVGASARSPRHRMPPWCFTWLARRRRRWSSCWRASRGAHGSYRAGAVRVGQPALAALVQTAGLDGRCVHRPLRIPGSIRPARRTASYTRRA